MKYAALNINFDSIGEMYGFPDGFRDPSFFEIADRFMDLSKKYGFKYSIYIIGKDLEKQENRDAVRSWFDLGHEIGNHSWSHRIDLGALPKKEIQDEVGRAHELISSAIGDKVNGFIAPAWSTSSDLLQTLIDFEYNYDTSSFPSWLMFPALTKLSMNFKGDSRQKHIWKRKDLGYCLRGGRLPYQSCGDLFGKTTTSIDFREASKPKDIVVLPIPTNKMRMACWHTTGFVFGWDFHKRLLRSCLKSNDFFYYLMHPADLMGSQDLDSSRNAHFERMGVSLEEKFKRLEECIQIILESGRQIVTVNQLAGFARKSQSEKIRPFSTSAI